MPVKKDYPVLKCQCGKLFQQRRGWQRHCSSKCRNAEFRAAQDAKAKELAARITNYLANGGFWNPEMMEHDKVRELLMDCRDHLAPRMDQGKAGGL